MPNLVNRVPIFGLMVIQLYSPYLPVWEMINYMLGIIALNDNKNQEIRNLEK